MGYSEVPLEEPILKRRDRTPLITIRSDINEAPQPPEVSKQIMTALQPLIASLPAGYRIELGGSIEEAAKANAALGKVFPTMIAAMLIVIMPQVRFFSTMAMVMLTAPLGLVGVVPMLLTFNQPFGFNAILGLIGLAGILMRNTLILTEQIKKNRAAGLDDYHAIIEATVQRTRPVILTAVAAVLAFIPLTHSVFWGSMTYTLIGGTAVGTVLILLFVPALYAAWFRIEPTADDVPCALLSGQANGSANSNGCRIWLCCRMRRFKLRAKRLAVGADAGIRAACCASRALASCQQAAPKSPVLAAGVQGKARIRPRHVAWRHSASGHRLVSSFPPPMVAQGTSGAGHRVRPTGTPPPRSAPT
ncbi:MAG: efflux RND transporter permease subunit [Acetobacteraceae bacterium]